MLRHSTRLRALTIRGLALAGFLILTAAPVLAQDGQRRTGDPVDLPGTDKLIPRADTSTPPPQTTDQILPPVPASVEDPAPPGTNAVPVVPNARQPVQTAPGRQGQAVPGIRSTEGVVVQLQPAGPDERTRPGLQNELIRLRIDPSQTWNEYANVGPETPAEDNAAPPNAAPDQAEARPKTDAPIVEDVKTVIKDVEEALKPDEEPPPPPSEREADARAAEREQEQPDTIEVVVTNRTRVFVHARSAEGVDMFGAETISSPDTTPSGVGITGRVPAQPRPDRFATNFTNIKVGSYVAVRYRPVRGMNEAVNVNLIELPLIAPTERATTPGAASVPGTRQTPPAPARPAPGTRQAPTARPAPGARPVPEAVPPASEVPVREPVVPAQPVIPAIPR